VTPPTAYRLLERGRVRAMVLAELADTLGEWLLAPGLRVPAGAEPLAGGRGAAWRIALPGPAGVTLRAVLRENRRGGLVRHLVARHYLGLRPRPFAELAVTAEARRRGVPAPEVLAARVDGRLVYRGALVTREIPGARPLLAALARAGDASARQALAAGAGRAVARLHGAGVFHADLNLGNILVSDADTCEHQTTLVDFDRARLTSGPLDAAARRRNLRRLGRSLEKLDPDGTVAGPETVAAFRRAYGPPAEAACGC
jgi:3-deoxy-D-manno-octulosonic acid kinase